MMVLPVVHLLKPTTPNSEKSCDFVENVSKADEAARSSHEPMFLSAVEHSKHINETDLLSASFVIKIFHR